MPKCGTDCQQGFRALRKGPRPHCFGSGHLFAAAPFPGTALTVFIALRLSHPKLIGGGRACQSGPAHGDLGSPCRRGRPAARLHSGLLLYTPGVDAFTRAAEVLGLRVPHPCPARAECSHETPRGILAVPQRRHIRLPPVEGHRAAQAQNFCLQKRPPGCGAIPSAAGSAGSGSFCKLRLRAQRTRARRARRGFAAAAARRFQEIQEAMAGALRCARWHGEWPCRRAPPLARSASGWSEVRRVPSFRFRRFRSVASEVRAVPARLQPAWPRSVSRHLSTLARVPVARMWLSISKTSSRCRIRS